MAIHKYGPELSARRPRSAGKAPPAIPGGWQAGFTLPPWHWLTAPYTFRPLFPFRATAASACNCSPRWVWRGLPLDGRQGCTRRAGGGCRDQCRASGAACVSSVKERGKGKTQAKPGEPGALRVSAKDRRIIGQALEQSNKKLGQIEEKTEEKTDSPGHYFCPSRKHYACLAARAKNSKFPIRFTLLHTPTPTFRASPPLPTPPHPHRPRHPPPHLNHPVPLNPP